MNKQERRSVKKLEWRFDEAFGVSRADTSWGPYTVRRVVDLYEWVGHSGGGNALYTTEAEAKAGAQIDYERRILSALGGGDGGC